MVDKRDFKDLKENPKNPRRISQFDFKNLVRSIKEFGDLSGIVFNLRTQQLVGGHQRKRALEELGGSPKIIYQWNTPDTPDSVGTVAQGHILIDGKHIPYREVDWDPEREAAANIAANRITGEWDLDLLAEISYQLQQESPDLLSLTGQSDEEISDLLDMSGVADSTLTEEDEAPEVEDEGEPVSRTGEIYQLGKHRLMCGDATNEDHVRALTEGKKADMVLTDPPYNIDYKGGAANKRDGIMNDKMSPEKFSAFLEGACSNLIKYTKGAMYICMSSSELDNLKRAFVKSGGHFQNYLIWVKNTFTIGGSDYQHQYEPILYGWPKDIKDHYYAGHRDKSNVWEDFKEAGAKFDGEYTTLSFGGYSVRILGQASGEVVRKKTNTDILRFDKPNKSEDHPTMKPLALCEEAIRNSSLRDGTVLDLFGGSGSTLIAADRIGRTCFMMELDPKYCDVIRKRYAEHVGQEDWQSATPIAG